MVNFVWDVTTELMLTPLNWEQVLQIRHLTESLAAPALCDSVGFRWLARREDHQTDTDRVLLKMRQIDSMDTF